WTAPCSFSITQPSSFVDTIGSSFDTVLAVFTGSTLSTLTIVASDNDSGGGGTSRVPATSPATLDVAAGTVFQIRVRGVSAASTGTVVLHINGGCSAASAPAVSAVTPSSGPGTGGTPITI